MANIIKSVPICRKPNWSFIVSELQQVFDLSTEINIFNIGEELLNCGFIEIGYGRHRVVFLTPSRRFVVKIPRNSYGLYDNEIEHIAYNKQRKNYYPLARCRLMRNKLILVMEYVKFVDIYSKPFYPEWVMFVDRGQVGYNRKEELVAYDYGR